MNAKPSEQIEYESAIELRTFVTVLLAISVGTLAAVLILPTWLPNLSTSLAGNEPKAFWYLSRGSSFVAMTLLWMSMAMGLTITSKVARTWPGAAAAFAIHEYVSLLGLIFAIFHALVLMGDAYIGFSLVQVLVPFTTTAYRPIMVGVGQVAFYVWLLVALSFYIRKQISQKIWRLVHYISFLVYCVALYHGISSGTDTAASWAQNYYWISGGSLLFLLVYRIVISIVAKASKPAPRVIPSSAGSTQES